VNVPQDNGLSALDVILAAAFGAKLSTQYLSNDDKFVLAQNNFWVIEAPNRLRALGIQRRDDCTICSRR
jgi:hypothetical protein